jgi:type II secretory pathway component GspD/PulD (secretin)
VSSDSSGKNLIVSAPKEYHSQIKKLILSLDNPSELPEVRVIPVIYGYSSDLALIMQNVIRVTKPNKVSSSQFGISSRFDIDTTGIVLSDDRTNQLIVISDKLTNMNIEKLVRAVDVKSNFKNSAFITKLKSANASDVVSIINNISRR